MVLDIINSKDLKKDKRFDSGFFLNEYAINTRVLEHNNSMCISLSSIAQVFNPPIFKRQFCQNTDRAVNYCQSSDVTNALEGSNVYINKIQAEKVGATVCDKQILVTGFGTIGNVRLINKLSEGVAYANNVCRIKVNDNNLYGFVYAFFASKYGHSQLNKNASGSVVRYIEAPGIKKNLIPDLGQNKQREIHNLIVEASDLRVAANVLLEEAISYFDSFYIDYKYGAYVNRKIKISNLIDKNVRIDASYAIITENLLSKFREEVKDCITISELTTDIFIGPRTKRNYLNKGVPFLSTSFMQHSNPTRVSKFINSKMAVDFRVKSGWLLTTRSGSLGDTIMVMDCIDEYAVSEDAIRMVFKEKSKLSNNYVYAFLKSNIGKNSLLANSYGSVIVHLNEGYIGDIKVPVLAHDEITLIDFKIKEHITNINEAILKENQAIELLEKEIDSWQN